jgi:hypothetical protein
MIPTAACGNMDVACKSGVGLNQNLVPLMTTEDRRAAAEYMGQTSTNYQRVALLAATAGRTDVALAYEIVAVAASALQQMLVPATGQVVIDLAADQAISVVASKTGIPKSILFEISERQVKPMLEPVISRINEAIHGEAKR